MEITELLLILFDCYCHPYEPYHGANIRESLNHSERSEVLKGPKFFITAVSLHVEIGLLTCNLSASKRSLISTIIQIQIDRYLDSFPHLSRNLISWSADWEKIYFSLHST